MVQPHRIIRLKGPVNVELLTIKGKHLLTHVNRIKPYLVPTRSDVQFEDEKLQNKNDEKQEKFQEKVEKEKEKPVENSDRPLRAHSPLPEIIDQIPLTQKFSATNANDAASTSSARSFSAA